LRATREALGANIKKMDEGKKTLFAVGDQLTADTGKLIEAGRASGDAAAAAIASLEPLVLLVRVSNWRFLATHEPKGAANFKNNVEKARQGIAALEKADPPANVRKLADALKATLGSYAAAFETTSDNLVKADELYRGDIRKLTIEAGDTLKGTEASLKRDLEATKTQTDAAISGTILTQEIVAGLAFGLGWRHRLPHRPRHRRPIGPYDPRHGRARGRRRQGRDPGARQQRRDRRHGKGRPGCSRTT